MMFYSMPPPRRALSRNLAEQCRTPPKSKTCEGGVGQGPHQSRETCTPVAPSAGLADAERAARCRELRALAHVYLGRAQPLTVALGEASAEPTALELVRAGAGDASGAAPPPVAGYLSPCCRPIGPKRERTSGARARPPLSNAAGDSWRGRTVATRASGASSIAAQC